MYVAKRLTRGMTLIDVLVGTAIAVIIFLAIFGLLRASAQISTLAAQTAAATAIAQSQMEYVRSLPYDDVGTVGGIPAGAIAQQATTTEDGIEYGVRTFIQYYDDPADGIGASDVTGVTEDYKRVKVTVTYYPSTGEKQLSVVSNVSPPGVESTTGGGTLRISVVNASGNPVSGAEVNVVNQGVSPAVDLATFSDSSGSVILPGAATSTDYEITVTKTGYSTAQTYDRDATNQNPAPGHLTVVANTTTSSTFAIDALATFIMRSFAPIAPGSWTDTFADATKLAAQTNTSVSGGALVLAANATSGTARSVAEEPEYLSSWSSLAASTATPAGTTLVLHVADADGALIPDAVLPGNSAGFSSFPVSLSGVATSTYPALAILADLSTNDASTTPSVTDWSLAYRAGPVPVSDVSFTLTGAKTIGSTGAGAPLYKTTITSQTGAEGSVSFPIEWDAYALSDVSSNVLGGCSSYSVYPGTTAEESLMLGSDTTNSLVVTAADANGNVLPGAIVTLSRAGFSETVGTNGCGKAYFGSLDAASDYAVSVTSGALSGSAASVSVSGHATYAITAS